MPNPRRQRLPQPIDAATVSALAHAVYEKARRTIRLPDAAALARCYRLVVMCAAWSGLRRSELVGLRVKDVHVLNAEITVTQSVHFANNSWRVDTPKSRESTGRRIPLPPTLAREISDYVQDRNLSPDAFLFGTDDGRPLVYDTFARHHFRRAARSIGLPTIRFHDLRHSFAALKLGQNYRLDQIKNWMGHHSIKITVDLYGSWVPDDATARQAADDAAYRAATPTAPVRPLRPAETG